MDFAVPADHSVKMKENEEMDKYLDLARELKVMEYESQRDTNCSWCTWNGPKRIGKGFGKSGDQRKD